MKKALKKPRKNQRKKIKPKICQVGKMTVHHMKVGAVKKLKIIHINRIGEIQMAINTNAQNVIIGDSLVDYCTYQESASRYAIPGKIIWDNL